MSLMRHIEHCNAWKPENFRPFYVGGGQVGWVRHAFADTLAKLADSFEVGDFGVALKGETSEERSRLLAHSVNDLIAEQAEPIRLRGEMFPVVADFGEPERLRIDRGLVTWFGVKAFGVHVNGYVRKADGLHLWVGRRAPDKHVAPDKLDNLVGGGQPVDISLFDNMLKEANEEAGLTAEEAGRAVPAGAVTYMMETGAGLKPDCLFVFDLEVPEGWTPENQDGEIVDYQLLPAIEVLRLLRETDAFKFNVPLTLIDFLIRHGLIRPDDEPDYLSLLHGLRQGPFGRVANVREPVAGTGKLGGV